MYCLLGLCIVFFGLWAAAVAQGGTGGPSVSPEVRQMSNHVYFSFVIPITICTVIVAFNDSRKHVACIEVDIPTSDKLTLDSNIGVH